MVKLVNLLIDLEIVSLFIVSFETFDELAILFDNKLITTHNTIHIQNESKLAQLSAELPLSSQLSRRIVVDFVIVVSSQLKFS